MISTMALGTSETLRSAPQAAGRSTLDRWGLVLTVGIVLAWGSALPLGFGAAVALLTALGFAAAVAGFIRPTIGLVGVTMLCVLDPASRIFVLSGGLLRWNTFNYWLLLISVLALPKLWRFRDTPTRLLELFSLLILLELVVSPDIDFGAQHLINMFSVFGLLVYFVAGGVRPSTWVWIGITGGMLGAVGGILYYLEPLATLYANPNAWSLFPLTALTAVCLGYPFAVELPKVRLVLGALAAVNLVCIFLSGSRGNLVTGSLCALFLIFVTPGIHRRALILATGAIVVLVVSSQFTNLQSVALHRLFRLLDPTVPIVSRTSGRSDLMLGAWYIFLDHPFGVGTGGFASAWAELGHRAGLSGFESGSKFQAHAGWFKILAENGLPGVFLLMLFVGSFTMGALRAIDRRARLLGYLTTAVLLSAWMTTEFQSKGLWMLAAASATLLRSAVPIRTKRRLRKPAALRPRTAPEAPPEDD